MTQWLMLLQILHLNLLNSLKFFLVILLLSLKSSTLFCFEVRAGLNSKHDAIMIPVIMICAPVIVPSLLLLQVCMCSLQPLFE